MRRVGIVSLRFAESDTNLMVFFSIPAEFRVLSGEGLTYEGSIDFNFSPLKDASLCDSSHCYLPARKSQIANGKNISAARKTFCFS